MESPLLSVENVTVSFDGFNALDGMSLHLMPASIRVLIGPNGAGKSTLLDAIIGHVRPSAGKVMFKGREITRMNEYRIVRKGICRKFQAPGILDSLTVEENLNLAARPQRECWRSFAMGFSQEVRARVERVPERIGLKDKRRAPAAQLSHGQKQWLEIGMVVASDADLLLEGHAKRPSVQPALAGTKNFLAHRGEQSHNGETLAAAYISTFPRVILLPLRFGYVCFGSPFSCSLPDSRSTLRLRV